MQYDLYIAGAISKSNKAGGFAAILISNEIEETLYTGGRYWSSIYRLELEALRIGIRGVRDSSLVNVHTTSDLILRMVKNDWLEKWNGQQWKKRAYADLLQQIYPYHQMLAPAGKSDSQIQERCFEAALRSAEHRYAFCCHLIPVDPNQRK